MKKTTLGCTSILTGVTLLVFLQVTPVFASQEDTAKDLTTLLRAGRAVTVNKTLISNPSRYKVDNFVKRTKRYYKTFSGKELDENNEMLSKLMNSMKKVIMNAKSGAYKDKWPSGAYANKFLPARFARQSGLLFTESTAGNAKLKLTTSKDLLVNKNNKADGWESSVIEGKFQSTDWEKGKAYSETTADGFRLMLPEYYISGCMGCHGGIAGKELHPGNVEGVVGYLGGAISVTLR